MGAGDHAGGRDPGSLRRPGDRLHRLPGSGAPGRRGPGHLSALHGDARGALRQGGARLLVLRLLDGLHHLRGRHRPLLGALASARVPELRAGPAARRPDAPARPRRDRRGLGLRVHAHRLQPALPRAPPRSRRRRLRRGRGGRATGARGAQPDRRPRALRLEAPRSVPAHGAGGRRGGRGLLGGPARRALPRRDEPDLGEPRGVSGELAALSSSRPSTATGIGASRSASSSAPPNFRGLDLAQLRTDPGLVPALRPDEPAGRLRGRLGGRLRPPVPGGGRPREAARLRRHALAGPKRDPRRQSRDQWAA